ncbi:MAG: hypothetical protein AAFQ62_11975 [Pseudomonadota bacterium]
MRFVTALTLALCLLLAACGGSEGPEEKIRAQIATLAEAAEDGEMGPFGDAIEDDYADLRGNDRRQALMIVRGVMLRAGGSLGVFPDVQQITLITDDLAEARVRTRFAGASLERFALETAVYTFLVTFERDGSDWRIVSARWAPGDDEPR